MCGEEDFMATIKNLTPHDVEVWCESGYTTFPKDPKVAPARVISSVEEEGHIVVNGLKYPVSRLGKEKTANLPPHQEGTWLIVSLVVRLANPTRGDLISPDTGYSAGRDADGQVMWVRGFIRN
jgi:hypothetical protein